MSDLAALQKRFLSYLADAIEPALESEIIPRPPLSAAKRLGIYRYAYFARIHQSIRDDFEWVERAVGAKRFRAWVRDYLQKYPSRYSSLTDVSCEFPKFLAQADVAPALVDLAEYEWLQIVCFYRDSLPLIQWQDRLAQNDAENLHILFQPSTLLFESKWAVHEVSIEHPYPKAKPTYLVMHREHYEAKTREVDASSFRVLQGLLEGRTLGEVLMGHSGSAFESFREWAQWGIIRDILSDAFNER